MNRHRERLTALAVSALLGGVAATAVPVRAQTQPASAPAVAPAQQAAPRDRLAPLLAKTPTVTPIEGGRATFLSWRDSQAGATIASGVELCVLELPAGGARLRLKDLSDTRPSAQVHQEAFPRTASLGSLTVGFFGLNSKQRYYPMGLVRSQGKSLSSRHPWSSGGVFGVREDGRAEILPIGQVTDSDASRYTDAVQSKPMLIEDGRDGIRTSTDERFDRGAVALDSRGNTYFFLLHSPLGLSATLGEFADLLRRYRSTRGDALTWALATDGGPSAHLWVPSLGRHCGSGVPAFVPNALDAQR